jgi:hypothetical protein
MPKFLTMFKSCTNPLAGCSTADVEADLKNAEQEAEVVGSKILATTGGAASYAVKQTDFLIPYLTAIAATTTDPAVKANVLEAIHVAQAINHASSGAINVTNTLKDFTVPTSIGAVGHDLSDLQQISADLKGTVNAMKADGVQIPITDNALNKLDNVLTTLSNSQQAVANVAAAAAPTVTTTVVISAPVAPTTTPAFAAAAAAQPTLIEITAPEVAPVPTTPEVAANDANPTVVATATLSVS